MTALLAPILTAVQADLTTLLLEILELDALPAGMLTVGRQPQHVQQVGLEVHVRPGPRRSEARGGGHQVQGYELDVLVRQQELREAAQTGETQVADAWPVAEAIADAFAVGPPANTAAVEGVIGSRAELDREDTDPGRRTALEVGCRVTVFTSGEVLPEEEP